MTPDRGTGSLHWAPVCSGWPRWRCRAEEARATHGSVYFKALDDATFFAANSLERRIVAEGELFDGDGALVARGRGRFARSRIPLSPAVHYR